ncbi:unnamed protein product [Polarella glacialis]|uniref:Transmembrane protein n=1 Tax=Polarella glacialis TaxID=89957 RepID=A0A813LC17_POLGL|nr:unnamed protein product [Polarella glacialis]
MQEARDAGDKVTEDAQQPISNSNSSTALRAEGTDPSEAGCKAAEAERDEVARHLRREREGNRRLQQRLQVAAAAHAEGQAEKEVLRQQVQQAKSSLKAAPPNGSWLRTGVRRVAFVLAWSAVQHAAPLVWQAVTSGSSGRSRPPVPPATASITATQAAGVATAVGEAAPFSKNEESVVPLATPKSEEAEAATLLQPPAVSALESKAESELDTEAAEMGKEAEPDDSSKELVDPRRPAGIMKRIKKAGWSGVPVVTAVFSIVIGYAGKLA